MSAVSSELPFVPIAKPLIGDAEKAAVMAVLDSGMLAQGKRVAEFEGRFAELCQVKHAVAVASGTAALWLSLLAHEIGPGDEVITTPFSFIASSNCILYVGATPVFVDRHVLAGRERHRSQTHRAHARHPARASLRPAL